MCAENKMCHNVPPVRKELKEEKEGFLDIRFTAKGVIDNTKETYFQIHNIWQKKMRYNIRPAVSSKQKHKNGACSL